MGNLAGHDLLNKWLSYNTSSLMDIWSCGPISKALFAKAVFQ